MGKITINELHKSLFDYVQAVSDDKLETRDKTIVGAINELFSNNNNDTELNNLINEISNGKQLIANAIGEPLEATDTFVEMSNDINSLLSTFKTNMMNNGVTVESGDKFKSLIDKIATMVEEGSNKGVQIASGVARSDSNYTITVSGLNFKPFAIYAYYEYQASVGGEYYMKEFPAIYVESLLEDERKYSVTYDADSRTLSPTDSITNDGGFNLRVSVRNVDFNWIAYGIGEEDTTLRDSLASILEEEGVEVTEEDDMASLITKVDEVFDNRKQILVNALVNKGLNAEITNTYEELITMISLLKYVPANSIINGNSTDSDFINGLTSYSKNRGDADSEITYSVSNNTIIVEGSADCVETTNGQADEGKRDLYIYNPSYTVDVTDYDVFKVIASYRFYDMEYGSLEVGLYTGSDFRNPVKTIENGDLDITDLTGEYHIVINAFVWNEYCLGETGILEGKVSYIGFE